MMENFHYTLVEVVINSRQTRITNEQTIFLNNFFPNNLFN